MVRRLIDKIVLDRREYDFASTKSESSHGGGAGHGSTAPEFQIKIHRRHQQALLTLLAPSGGD